VARWNRRKFLGVTSGSLLGMATLGGGCSRSESPPAPITRTGPSGVKVAIVGIDGATFDIIQPMANRGELPWFRQLLVSGSYARLRSANPMYSPALWSTIATGRHRADHGIHGFLRTDESGQQLQELITSQDRLKPALWNIASAFDLTTSVIGWWVTWPAEKVNGLMVSDRLANTMWGAWTGGAPNDRLVFPADRYAKATEGLVDPKHPPVDEMRAMADWSDRDWEELLTAKEPILAHGPSVYKFGYCEQRSYEEVALAALDEKQPDLFQVFLIAVDPICHSYWHFQQPEAFEDRVDADELARMARLIPNAYRHNDEYLGRLLPRLDEDTVVILVSDHGFKASDEVPIPTSTVSYELLGLERVDELEKPMNVGMSGIHDIEGILVASGGPIVRGATAVFQSQPQLVDVAPTVLALLGLPVGRDMPGRVLEEIIEPEFLAAHPIQYVDSHDALAVLDHAESTQGGAGEDAKMEYLRSLGYIE
jgi:hypothetical protein